MWNLSTTDPLEVIKRIYGRTDRQMDGKTDRQTDKVITIGHPPFQEGYEMTKLKLYVHTGVMVNLRYKFDFAPRYATKDIAQ